MRYAILAGVLVLLVSIGFSMEMGMHGEVTGPMGNMSVNMSVNETHGEHRAEVEVNHTENGTEVVVQKTITTKHGTVIINKVIEMMRNRENRTFVFKMMNNNSIPTKERVMIRSMVLNMIKENSTIRKELRFNKTMLMQFVPKYKHVIEKAKVENVTVKEEGNSTVVIIKIREHKRLLGLIPVEVPEEIITNETTSEIKHPWWAIFAI